MVTDKTRKHLIGCCLITMLFQGIINVSSGVILPSLQAQYGFDYNISGLLLALISFGNIFASFLCGILSGRIGRKNSALLLCSGAFIGYAIMPLFGGTVMLCIAFALIGLSKGGMLNTNSVIMAQNYPSPTKGTNLMHGMYAVGALLCPFISAALQATNMWTAPIIGLAIFGLLFWLSYVAAPIVDTAEDKKAKTDWNFMKDKGFWLVTGLIMFDNCVEISVTGWLVTYFKDMGILSGTLSEFTVTAMWTAMLVARLLIAFVIPLKGNVFKHITIMSVFSVIFYTAMLFVHNGVAAIVLLFLFGLSIAGVNPTSIGSAGKSLTPASVGVMLPIAGIGAVVMPYITGKVAQNLGIRGGMLAICIAAFGMLVFSILCLLNTRRQTKKDS